MTATAQKNGSKKNEKQGLAQQLAEAQKAAEQQAAQVEKLRQDRIAELKTQKEEFTKRIAEIDDELKGLGEKPTRRRRRKSSGKAADGSWKTEVLSVVKSAKGTISPKEIMEQMKASGNETIDKVEYPSAQIGQALRALQDEGLVKREGRGSYVAK